MKPHMETTSWFCEWKSMIDRRHTSNWEHQCIALPCTAQRFQKLLLRQSRSDCVFKNDCISGQQKCERWWRNSLDVCSRLTEAGWQKLCEGTMAFAKQVLTWTKNFSTIIGYFVAVSRFVAIYAILEDLGQKVFFGTTTVFLGQEMHYYIVLYIAHYTESNLQKPRKNSK